MIFKKKPKYRTRLMNVWKSCDIPYYLMLTHKAYLEVVYSELKKNGLLDIHCNLLLIDQSYSGFFESKISKCNRCDKRNYNV